MTIYTESTVILTFKKMASLFIAFASILKSVDAYCINLKNLNLPPAKYEYIPGHYKYSALFLERAMAIDPFIRHQSGTGSQHIARNHFRSEKKEMAQPRKETEKAEITPPYRWENSFNIIFTSLFGKSTLDLNSPSFLAEGSWSYRYSTGTSLGLMALGSLQSMAVSRDEAKLSFTTYAFGPYIAQEIIRTDDYRLIGSLSAGKGYLFVRRNPYVGNQVFYKSEYIFFQPEIAFIFYQTRHYEIGPVLSYRKVTLAHPMVYKPQDQNGQITGPEVTVASEKDLNSMSFGVSIRAVSL